MSTTGIRIKKLREYNLYDQEKLARTCGLTYQHLLDLEQDKEIPSLQDAQDLSQILGVDASYLQGKEEKYYLGYVHVTYLLEENQYKEVDTWEQTLIRSDLDIYDYTVVMDEERYLRFMNEKKEVVYKAKDLQDIMLSITRRIKKGEIDF